MVFSRDVISFHRIEHSCQFCEFILSRSVFRLHYTKHERPGDATEYCYMLLSARANDVKKINNNNNRGRDTINDNDMMGAQQQQHKSLKVYLVRVPTTGPRRLAPAAVETQVPLLTYYV